MRELELDHYVGCLLGGAVGDALGAPIEFDSIGAIRMRYGPDGVQTYVKSADGKGHFTDDTQMTLFTAEGLLRARQREMLKGIGGARLPLLYQSYLRWLKTQGLTPREFPTNFGIYDVEHGWLMRQKGLFVRRAPGKACINSLESGKYGTVDRPLNDRKRCGGVMRVAPVGLVYADDAALAFEVGCQAAALTHGHPSGYLSAGCLAAILALLAQGESLPQAIDETVVMLERWQGHQECLGAIQRAVAKVKEGAPTPERVESLGEAWVGEETLAIALYCALSYPRDFRAGVLAAVNHSGDCDSTGAVTGNILGLTLGKEAIPQTWIENLDMADVVEQVAIDLYSQFKGELYSADNEWMERYPPA